MYNSYLMWVGSDNYPTIEDWVKEAEKQGVSKRIPNASVGANLKEPGTIIFVAHDEGEWRDCEDCFGVIENPEWRKKEEEIHRYAKEVEIFKKELDKLTNGMTAVPGIEDKEKEKRKKYDSLNRKIAKRQYKITEIEKETKDVEERIEGGTGGTVTLARADTPSYIKEVIDYRKYDYWHHQPKKFSQRWQFIGEPEMCKACGGKGKLPEAKIFGLFVPSCVEYVMKKEDGEEVENEMKRRGFSTVPTKVVKMEEERKCGVRKEGGFYVVTDKDALGERAKEAVEKLVASGTIKPEMVDIKGDFVNFLTPIPVNVKRFRGIKKWRVEEGSDLEEGTEMIMDALS